MDAVTTNALFTVALLLNMYKPILMLAQSAYNIFPWSPQPHVSESSMWWLVYHWTTSMLLLLSARKWHLASMRHEAVHNPGSNIVMKNHYGLTVLLFLIFDWGVILNMSRLGALPPHTAFAVNLTALTLLSFALYNANSRMFFILLNAPVFLELIKLMAYIFSLLNQQVLIVLAVFSVIYFIFAILGPLMGVSN
jgi:hypothetical protein